MQFHLELNDSAEQWLTKIQSKSLSHTPSFIEINNKHTTQTNTLGNVFLSICNLFTMSANYMRSYQSEVLLLLFLTAFSSLHLSLCSCYMIIMMISDAGVITVIMIPVSM